MTNSKLTDDPMSLDAAITHADERAASLSGPCAVQHMQLANWLRELQERRKADSAEPVADVVEWRKEGEERLCDIRWRRFDVSPGPLYSIPQRQSEQQNIPENISVDLRARVRQEHAEWAQSTFGDIGPIGPLKHLSKEALEAADMPGDLHEWADMQFLLWDAQRRAGISDDQITGAMVEKLAINKERAWPEPKDGEPRYHIPQPVMKAECAICGKGCTNASHPMKAVAVEPPLNVSERAELQAFRRAACNHGYPPGAHTHGVVGCEKCCGRRVMNWELGGGHTHQIPGLKQEEITPGMALHLGVGSDSTNVKLVVKK